MNLRNAVRANERDMNDDNRSVPKSSPKNISPHVCFVVCLFGILQFWTLMPLICDIPPAVAFASYFIHWSSVGALIQFALSKKRNMFLGAITGVILSALLMC